MTTTAVTIRRPRSYFGAEIPSSAAAAGARGGRRSRRDAELNPALLWRVQVEDVTVSVGLEYECTLVTYWHYTDMD